MFNVELLNQYINYAHFKMEGLKHLKSLIREGDYMIKIDLKDAYFAIPIHDDHKKFLKFRWLGKLYQYTCLPFGVSQGPRRFTKLLKPLINFLRKTGIRLVQYLDDFLFLHQDPLVLEAMGSVLLQILTNLGFTPNMDKSVLVPTTELDFLGMLVNSRDLTLNLPLKKKQLILEETKSLLAAGRVRARQLATLLGRLTASWEAVI